MSSPSFICYAQPCDHCQGEIVSIPNGPWSFIWRCSTCECQWARLMTPLKSGFICPVHGDPSLHRCGGVQATFFARLEGL